MTSRHPCPGTHLYTVSIDIISAVGWSSDERALRIIDQRRLPAELVQLELRSVDEICDAIASLAVRGAPAIGIAGAIGLAVVAQDLAQNNVASFRSALREAAQRIRSARPTAVNLPWAIDRLCQAVAAMSDVHDVVRALCREASAVLDEDRAMCEGIGRCGVALVPDGSRVLTHCNAGALATGGIGTALAPVYLAARLGRRVSVWVDETRPLLQGSRLTAWELDCAGIPTTIIADSMAASLMLAGEVDLVIVGADRIAANGDVANKIGTYGLAVLAHHHDVPFYVAAPSSTFDPETATGAAIRIEHRPAEEIRNGFGRLTAPEGVAIHNPAFDVTPAALITAIVSERATHFPPFDFSRAAPVRLVHSA